MTTGQTVYQPKGGMCMTCQHMLVRNCSALLFSTMPVIGKFLDVQIVKCTGFVKLVKTSP